jgi:alkyl hydroperoxide reductase subunit F
MELDFNFNLSNFTESHRAVPLDTHQVYDVLILGGGPAALTAAVYCMRKGIRAGLITKAIGGQVAETATIENYMGYMHIEGTELVNRFRDQVRQFEIGYKENAQVTSLEIEELHTVQLDDGSHYQTRALIIATGKSSRRLNVPGEREFTGKGVAYCATCDAPLFAGKKVAVVGGGNSGVEAVLDLLKIVKQVILIQQLSQLTADQILIDKLRQHDHLEILYEHEVVILEGTQKLESVLVREIKSGRIKKIAIQGLFVEIGLIPNTDFVKAILPLNPWGEIPVDCNCRTGISGIFAAGDVTTVPYKQIIIAAGEGAKAALAACEYLLTNT